MTTHALLKAVVIVLGLGLAACGPKSSPPKAASAGGLKPTPSDTDGDGLINDEQDRCNTVPEDFDGTYDDDGCPDDDNDEDEIFDADDACPNDPEYGAGDAPDDGCPGA
jgi:hypothetical protein